MAYNGQTKSFFLDLFYALHDLENDEFRIALYTDRSIMSANLTEYTEDGEVMGTNYPSGGLQLFPTAGWPKATEFNVAEMRFDTVTFANITASIGAALIYNAVNNRSIRCIDFGENVIVTTSDFNITFPLEAEPPILIKLPVR